MKQLWEIAEDDALLLVRTGFPKAKKTKGTGAVSRDMDIIDTGLFVEVKSRNKEGVYIPALDIKETLSKIKRRHGIWFFIYMNNKYELYVIVEKKIFEIMKLAIKPQLELSEITKIQSNKSISANKEVIELLSSRPGYISIETCFGEFYLFSEKEFRIILTLIKGN